MAIFVAMVAEIWMHRKIQLLLLFSAIIFSVGENTYAESERPLVLVSVPPQSYVVKRIAADTVDVISVIPPTANHGTYEPSIEKLRLVSHAKIYIAVGHPGFSFEKIWLRRLTDQNPKLTVLDTSVGIPLLHEDPHLWVSPRAVAQSAKTIADALSERFPNNRALYNTNLAALEQDIHKLDAELRTLFQPYRGRAFLVFHPAWSYLAHDYGLVQLALENEGKETDAGTLAKMISEAKGKGIHTIFTQPQHSQESVEVLGEEIGARLVAIDCFAESWLENIRTVSHQIASSFAAR